MDIIPLNVNKLFSTPHEVQPIKAAEKTSPYGKEKKEPDKKDRPASATEKEDEHRKFSASATEKEDEHRKSKEVGKGNIADFEA